MNRKQYVIYPIISLWIIGLIIMVSDYATHYKTIAYMPDTIHLSVETTKHFTTLAGLVSQELIKETEREKQKEYVQSYIDSQKAVSLQCKNQVSRIVNETEKPKKNNKKYSEPTDITKIKSVQLNQAYMNIKCDAISLYTKVFFGDDGNIIDYGVGQYAGSKTPGNGKMILLDSHNHTYFKPLKNIKVNDKITLETFYGTFDYQVYAISVFHEKDLENYILEHLNDDEEILILYTCYPFKQTSYRKYQRYVVFAK